MNDRYDRSDRDGGDRNRGNHNDGERGERTERIVDWDELYPGRFLKAGLLAADERRVLTITNVSRDELEGNKGKQIKGILTFAEDRMQLPLNKTNGICLREMFGRVPYEWEGKRIALFSTEWGGEPAIRIWGSPDIERDLVVNVELPRKRPFKMTMHAMPNGRRPPRGQQAQQRSATPPPEQSPECRAELTKMAATTTLDGLTDLETEIALRAFSDYERDLMGRALARRRKQIKEGSSNHGQ